MKIKKGDKVKVLCGKDRGKIGEVIRVNKKAGKVMVKGVNMITKAEKKVSEEQKGGLIKQEGFFDKSNVQLIDPKTEKPTRVGFEIKDNKKVRISKKTKNVI